jgi:hypothetical protein
LFALKPSLDDQVASMAEKLHRQLISHGVMLSYFSDELKPTYNETGRIREFEPGSIRFVTVDSMEVPILMRLLKRTQTPRNCEVCMETIFDVDYGSMGNWIKFCMGLPGSWMWEILSYVDLRCGGTFS